MSPIRKVLTFVFSLMPALTHTAGAMASLPATDEAWQQAQAEDTLPAYSRFILEHPDSPHADMARAKIERFQGGVAVARVTPMAETPQIDAGADNVAPSVGGLLMNI